MKDSSVRGLLAALACLAILPGPARAFDICGELTNAYGPFDFYTDKDKLPIVESAHFTPSVETLRAGITSSVGREIDYTLRAFPNHPRALMAMVRLGEKERSEHPKGSRWSVTCYLERAIRFRPEDGMARMIYGIHLAKQKKNKEAVEQLEKARELAEDNANLHYNLGLVYFDLGRYDDSLKHAHEAYRLGFQLMGLKNKLVKAKQWRDPAPAAAEAPAAEVPAAAAGAGAGSSAGPAPASAAEPAPPAAK